MRIKKLCVGIPNTGVIKTETVYSTIMAMFHTVMKANCGIHLILPVSCYLTENREHCANEALEVGASHLMFIDSDMSFPEDGILTLASRDKYVIGANYNMRTMRGSTVKILGEDGQFVAVPGDQLPKQPFKCGAVATGFMLINTIVFKQLEKPWFFFTYNATRDATEGEDVYFCRKLREKGIDIWCDPTIPVGHIGDFTY